MGTSSSVTFNDIKHLTRSMPADGLEAQDVVPPRCGCWGCPQAKHLPAFLHARARQPSQLSLISLAFLSRVRKYGRLAGQLFPVPLIARPLLSISAFRAKFGLGVIWLSAVRVGGLFRVATPLEAGERPMTVASEVSGSAPRLVLGNRLRGDFFFLG